MKHGEHAPFFDLPGVDGRRYRPENIQGAKATVVVFSCNHCPYVVMNEERLIAIARKYAPLGVGMAFVNANDASSYPDDSFENMKARARDKNYPFPYLQDETQQTARVYGAAHTPHVFAFDRTLHLAYTGAVDDDNNHNARKTAEKLYLIDALDDLIAGRPVRLAETPSIGCSIKWK
jgi:peroxiredoxin